MKSYTWRHAIINSDLESPTRHVLLTLSCHINDAGEAAYPSTKTLARECKVSEPTVVKHLRLAKMAGWLIVQKHGFGGQNWSRNQYYPRIPDGFEIPDWNGKGTEGALVPSHEKLSTEVLKQVKRVGKKGTKGDLVPSAKALNLTEEGTKADSKRHLTSLSLTTQGTTQLTTLSAGEGGEEKTEEEKAATPTAAFDRFWDVWPSHSGRKSNRAACLVEWTAQTLDKDVELLVIHVQAMKLTKKWRDGYDPAPIRYLQEHWWQDGVPEALPAPPVVEEFEGPWFESDSGINAKGKQLGVPREKDEATPMYLLRVCKAAGRGPWIDHMLAQAKRSNSDKWYRQVVSYLGEGLMPTDFYAS